LPWASNVNVDAAGATAANQVIVPLGADGSVTLYTHAGTHLLADVAGWFSDTSAPIGSSGLFVPVVPERHLDTRNSGAPVAAASSVTVSTASAAIPSTGVGAVVANVTATDTAGAGFVTAYPSGTSLPWASNVNVGTAGATVAGHVTVLTGTAGGFDLYTHESGHLVADLMGWYLA
jgi:hypothetical protein